MPQALQRSSSSGSRWR